MKTFLAALALSLCIEAHSEKLKSKGLIFYDTNARDGAAYVADGPFRGMEPHDGSLGIVMFGGSVPAPPWSYVAPPRGPLVLSFVQNGKPAIVTKLDFWVSNPLGFLHYPTPVPILLFDAQGAILSTQEIAQLEFPFSVRGAGRIASIQIGEFEYPKDLMVSDVQFNRPRVSHAPTIQLFDPEQLQNAMNFIDFETYPDGTSPVGNVSREWQELGVLFSDVNGNSANIYTSLLTPNPGLGSNLPTRSGTNGIVTQSQTLVITFIDPASGQPGIVREAGVWVSNGGSFGPWDSTTVQFLDGKDQVVETVTSAGKFFFAGARSKKGIARIVLTDPDRFLADDLQFSKVRRK